MQVFLVVESDYDGYHILGTAGSLKEAKSFVEPNWLNRRVEIRLLHTGVSVDGRRVAEIVEHTPAIAQQPTVDHRHPFSKPYKPQPQWRWASVAKQPED